ncbi:SulP family inorganic anion transporter [Nocardioides euryhalodurans]|uniref:SulP family inorganic anion transporter n=1 Tax=Nocardioides euryhalodurans TaxID=2518370 RepID=A0A4P7GHY4_9ACTN|nr:SulP family inorganic anion transporter [Nocardioides euryhalodurans]QBR91495.1 SulP family inorganic anion transporter [Nocardioides euryhalodurans]
MRLGRPTGKDAVSGFVTGLFSIPEGMAYASIGGFAAPLGLWSGVVPTIVGSVFARTVLMVTTLTSAIALSSQSVLAGAGLDPGDAGALATLTVLVGLVMLGLGLLRLGSVMSFVSTAVMTGFTTGIALQIITGVIEDATGYDPTPHNTIAKVVDAAAHIGDWSGTTVAVSLATVGVWAAFRAVRPLRSFAILIALLTVSVVCAVVQPEVELVDDIASIPRSLPPFSLPDPGAVPELALGAVAIALVALAQAAGIGAAVSNPDGSRPDASTDFRAQGLANVAGGLFSALPTGGSLSRTGVGTSAGARTRWSGIFAGVWLAVIVLAVGPVAGKIPMAVIGGLLLVIGGELLAGRFRDIVLVLRTSWLSSAAMVVTFLATTELPLQQAIFLGAGLSILLYAVSAAGRGQLVELVPAGGGGWRITEPPPTIASDRTTVLHYVGGGFFAEVNRLEEEWPDPGAASQAAVVLSMRGSGGIPSATFLKSLERACLRLREHDVHLVLCGVTPAFRDLLERTGTLDVLGHDAVVVQSERLLDSVATAYAIAERRRAVDPGTR